MIVINAVETPNGVFIHLSNNGRHAESYRFDGVSPNKTWVIDWWSLPSSPKKLSRMQRQQPLNYRYRLIDETLESDKLPLELKREEVAVYEDYSWVWKNEFGHLRSLYHEVSDPQPDIEIVEEFEYNVLLSVPEITPPDTFSYPYAAHTNFWTSDKGGQITNKDVRHQLLDKLLFTPVLLHQTPCTLTSKQSYGIIRAHVKDNINPAVAKITSDYDFCFTVRKRVPKTKAHKYTVDVNLAHNLFSGRKRRPKYETRTQNESEWPCFEMTYSPENYKGYTPIKGFSGDTEEDLKKNIDEYLEELMAAINEPLQECPTCEGVGVLKRDTQVAAK